MWGRMWNSVSTALRALPRPHSPEELLGPKAWVAGLRAAFQWLSCTIGAWTRLSDLKVRILPCGHRVDATWIPRETGWPVIGTELHLESEDLG